MAKKPIRYDPDSIWIVIQEGGTSREIYLHPFDNAEDAERHAKSCERASYNVLKTEEIGGAPAEQAIAQSYVAMRMSLRALTILMEDSEIPDGFATRAHDALEKAIEEMEKDEMLPAILKAHKFDPIGKIMKRERDLTDKEQD